VIECLSNFSFFSYNWQKVTELKMMKMRIVLVIGLLAVLCLSVRAEDPQAEPAAAEPEPNAEPESTAHDDHKHAGSSKIESGELKLTIISLSA